MKNKLIIILTVISVILMAVGIFYSISLNSKPEEKKLRKIYEEDINHDTAEEIVQFYVEQKEQKKILNAKLIAATEDGEYLVRVELEDVPGETKETTMQYLGDGEWSVKFPIVEASNYSDKYTIFWPENPDTE